jgi:hypothetical protein
MMSKLFDFARLVPKPLLSMVRQKRSQTFDMETALQQYHGLKSLSQDRLDEKVHAAIEIGRKQKMTAREREAQLVSFVWGNAPEGNQGTRETVRKNLGSVSNT